MPNLGITLWKTYGRRGEDIVYNPNQAVYSFGIQWG